MNCSEMQAVLPALAEREGTPRVAFQAAKHLAICVTCAERLLRLRELNGLLDRLPDEEVPPSFTRRVLRALPRKLGASSGIVVLAALAGRGPLHTALSLGWQIMEAARGPFQAAASAIATFLSAALDLATSARAAMQDSPLALSHDAFRAGGFTVFAGAAPALVLAGALIVGAGIAFARSASLRWRERPRFPSQT